MSSGTIARRRRRARTRDRAWDGAVLTLPVHSASGELVGEEAIASGDFGGRISKQLLHEVVLMQMANKRVGTVNTRGRADVAGSGKKLFRQKGTGNARVGSKRTNKRKGGGVAFARRNRDYRYAMPRKAVRLSVRMALLSKFLDRQALVLDGPPPTEGKTRDVVRVLKALRRPDLGSDEPASREGESKAQALARTLHDRTVLIGLPDYDVRVYRAARNIPGVTVAPVSQFNTYDILKHRYLLLTREALDVLREKVAAPVERRPTRHAPMTAPPAKTTTKPKPRRSGILFNFSRKIARSIKNTILTLPDKLATGHREPPPERIDLGKYGSVRGSQSIFSLEGLEDLLNELEPGEIGTQTTWDPPEDATKFPDERRDDPPQDSPTALAPVKRPHLWIADPGADVPEPPLRLGEPYELKIRMGEPGPRTFAPGTAGDVPLEDIPSFGLNLLWILTSEEVELRPSANDPEVSVTALPGDRPAWTARFRLKVERDLDSETRRLIVVPRRGGRINVLIFIESDSVPPEQDIYRHFDVDLPLAD